MPRAPRRRMECTEDAHPEKGGVTGKAPSALRFSTQELKGGKRWDGRAITGPNVFKMVISILDRHAVTREKLKRPCPRGAIG